MKTFFISLLTALHLFQPAVLTSVQEAPPQEQDTARYNILIDWSQIPDEFDIVSYPALGQGEIRLQAVILREGTLHAQVSVTDLRRNRLSVQRHGKLPRPAAEHSHTCRLKSSSTLAPAPHRR